MTPIPPPPVEIAKIGLKVACLCLPLGMQTVERKMSQRVELLVKQQVESTCMHNLLLQQPRLYHLLLLHPPPNLLLLLPNYMLWRRP